VCKPGVGSACRHELFQAWLGPCDILVCCLQPCYRLIMDPWRVVVVCYGDTITSGLRYDYALWRVGELSQVGSPGVATHPE
jgi:hypothetical protein